MVPERYALMLKQQDPATSKQDEKPFSLPIILTESLSLAPVFVQSFYERTPSGRAFL